MKRLHWIPMLAAGIALSPVCAARSLAADQNPFVCILRGIGHALNPNKISDLPDGASLPVGWAQQASIDDTAREVVARVQKEEDLIKPDEKARWFFPIDLKHDTDIMLFFPSSQIQKIEKQGFLNIHQTSNKSGLQSLSWFRAFAEDVAVGLKLGHSSAANRLRFKSAFLNVRGNIAAGYRERGDLGRYGDAVAVLDDDVKDRSLWSTADFTFNMAAGMDNEAVLKPYAKFLQSINFFRPKTVPKGLELYERIGSFSRSGLTDAPVPRVSKMDGGGPEYAQFETLVFGDVSSQSDVKYFLAENPETARRLFHQGKPVYQSMKTTIQHRDVYFAGPELHPGSNLSAQDSLTQDSSWTTRLFATFGEKTAPLRVSSLASDSKLSVYDLVGDHGQYRVFMPPTGGTRNATVSLHIPDGKTAVTHTMVAGDFAPGVTNADGIPTLRKGYLMLFKKYPGEVPVEQLGPQDRQLLAQKLMTFLKTTFFETDPRIIIQLNPKTLSFRKDLPLIWDGDGPRYGGKSQDLLKTLEVWKGYFDPATLAKMEKEISSWK